MHALLTPLLRALESRVPTSSEVTQPVIVDREQLGAVCARLDALFAEHDTEAGDELRAHAELLRAAFPEAFQSIQDAVNAFNFKGARSALAAALSRS